MAKFTMSRRSAIDFSLKHIFFQLQFERLDIEKFPIWRFLNGKLFIIEDKFNRIFRQFLVAKN